MTWRLPCILACLTLPLLAACEKSQPAQTKNAIDAAALCHEVGGELDRVSNTCVCPAGKEFDGRRCLDANGAGPPPITPPTIPSSAQAEAPTPTPAPTEEPAASPPEVESQVDLLPPAPSPTPNPAQPNARTSRLMRACRVAKGLWVAADSYCHCLNGRVLVGSRCRTLPGRLTDDVCKRAVFHGKWEDGECRCPGTKLFSPSRGGCVARAEVPPRVLRRICESSLDQGIWDPPRERCVCPTGKLWQDELCQTQGQMSSKAVCESAFHRGKWSPERKTCMCPAGYVWLDQACRPAGGVSPRDVCASEANGGTWSEITQRCACPGGRHWSTPELLCK